MRLQKLTQLHMVNALHSNPQDLRSAIIAELTNDGDEDNSLMRDCAFFDAVARSVAAKVKRKG